MHQRGAPSQKSKTGERNSLLCLVEEVCRIRAESLEKLVDRLTLDSSVHLLVSHVQRLMQQLAVLSPCFTRWLHPVNDDSKAAGPAKQPLAYAVVKPHPILCIREGPCTIWYVIRKYSQIHGHRAVRAVTIYARPLVKKLIANTAIIYNDVRHMQHLEENKPPFAAIR
jgi:hypothetical protein